MDVHLLGGITRSELAPLIERLEAEEFARGCTISAIEPDNYPEERRLYVRMPNTQHGVLLAATEIDATSIDWAIEALRLSVTLAPAI